MDNKWVKMGLDILRGMLYAVALSVFLVLGLALLIKFTCIDSTVVSYINTGIKVITMFLGIFFGMKEMKAGMAKGAASGLLYILLSFLVFRLISGGSYSLTIFDVILGVVAGLISGVATVNIKKK